MHPLKIVTAISYYLLLVSLAQRPAEAFWLTDGSLFQEPSDKQVPVLGDIFQPAALDTNPVAQRQEDSSALIATVDLDNRRAARPGRQSEAASVVAQVSNNDTQTLAAAKLAANGGAIVTNRIEPWIRLADISSSSNNNNNNAHAIQTTASSQVSFCQAQEESVEF